MQESYSTETTALFFYLDLLPVRCYVINFIREILKWLVPIAGVWSICGREEEEVTETIMKFAALMTILKIDGMLIWDWWI